MFDVRFALARATRQIQTFVYLFIYRPDIAETKTKVQTKLAESLQMIKKDF